MAVRNERDITTNGGARYKKGSLWRVSEYANGTKVTIWGINPDGTDEPKNENGDARAVTNVDPEDLIIDPTIPLKKKKAT